MPPVARRVHDAARKTALIAQLGRRAQETRCRLWRVPPGLTVTDIAFAALTEMWCAMGAPAKISLARLMQKLDLFGIALQNHPWPPPTIHSKSAFVA